MDFTGTYTRKPFAVEAIEITEENIALLAPLLGELKEKDGVPFIALDKRIVPNIHRAFIGWWVTRMDDNLRCYSPKIFEEQFEPASAEVEYKMMVTKGAVLAELDVQANAFVTGHTPNGPINLTLT